MKEFKAESKKLLDLMINSIYTNKEIFLRELISNCSDAIDKRHFKSLTDEKARTEFCIKIDADKKQRMLTITDNGCGMTAEELENNLGTIAKSGTLDFKKEHADEKSPIGQFGVGFYSAFMVADSVTVLTRPYDSAKAYKWTSSGADGYEIEEAQYFEAGTQIILRIKDNDKDFNYDKFLDKNNLKELVKKYSDYIRYPIKMEMEVTKLKDEKAEKPEYEKVKETVTLNSMMPLWRKPKGKIKKEEYDDFYMAAFRDYMPPLKNITAKLEGAIAYTTLLFVPKKQPLDYHSKEYKRGLMLYCDGVMVMERCGELIPEYLGFIKGVVDTSDLSLNISRELLQHTRQLKSIEASLEKKIISEFKKMLAGDERKLYEEMFAEFGESVKFGAYADYGAKKDMLKDILVFPSSAPEAGMATFFEYVSRMKEGQDAIYYACGSNPEQIKSLPRCAAAMAAGYEVLLLTDHIDEFVMKVIGKWGEKDIKPVSEYEAKPLSGDEQKDAEEKSGENKELLESVKKALKGKIKEARLSNGLLEYAVSLKSEGAVTLDMEKVFSMMHDGKGIVATKILELNPSHAVFEKMKKLAKKDEQKLSDYAHLLYYTALLQEGMPLNDNGEYAKLVQKLI